MRWIREVYWACFSCSSKTRFSSEFESGPLMSSSNMGSCILLLLFIRRSSLLMLGWLEIAMSINCLNKINVYWSLKMFLGNRDFYRAMSPTDFTNIRRYIRLYPVYDNEIAARDSLSHSRVIMNSFFLRSTTIAFRTSVKALDEVAVRYSARTSTKTYIAKKTISYVIRFYATVGHMHR